MSDTPELDRQLEIIKSGKAGIVQEFLDWLLDDQGFRLCEFSHETQAFEPIYTQREQLMADHFDIDRDKIEKERRMLLSQQQNLNEGTRT